MKGEGKHRWAFVSQLHWANSHYQWLVGPSTGGPIAWKNDENTVHNVVYELILGGFSDFWVYEVVFFFQKSKSFVPTALTGRVDCFQPFHMSHRPSTSPSVKRVRRVGKNINHMFYPILYNLGIWNYEFPHARE